MAFVKEHAWVTEAGLPAFCIIVHGSHRCGYVGVPTDHPLYGVEYSEPTLKLGNVDLESLELGKKGALLALTAVVDALDGDTFRRSPDVVFDVHGGLTYSGKPYWTDEDEDYGDYHYFGFDCAHAGDGSMDPSRIYIFTDGPVRTMEYVIDECESLAKQIASTEYVQ